MATQAEMRNTPETILLWFLQVLGAITAILFGVISALSWQAADVANQLAGAANAKSDAANLVALVALCAQVTSSPDVSNPKL